MPVCHKTFAEREVAKGVSFWFNRPYAATPVTTFVRMAGVLDISGPSMEREGNIELNELDPSPDTLPNGECEEEYFFKSMFPGNKQTGAMTLTLNMKYSVYKTLVRMYVTDEIFGGYILLRSGHKIYGEMFVNKIDLSIDASNKFVNTPVEFQPTKDMKLIDNPATTTTTTTAAPPS